MTEAIAGALWASIAGSVIAALLATIVETFTRLKRPAAATRCVLWLVVLSTCLLAPVAIFGVMNLPSVRSSASTDGVGSVRTWNGRDTSGPRVRVRRSAFVLRTLLQRLALESDIAGAIAGLGVGGALVGCIGLLRSVARVGALKRRSSPLDGSLVDDLPWLTQRPGREIYLRLSHEIETPIAIGFRRPVVLIPMEMATRAGLAAIEPLVIHEYAHLARYDDWTNLWQRAVERVVWWNPLVYYAGRRLALEREVAADGAVVERTHDAAHYASTLWRLAREMRMPEHVVVAPGAMLSRKQISIRIERLLDDSIAPQAYAGAGLAVAAFAACAVAAVAASAPRFEYAPLLPSIPRFETNGEAKAIAVASPAHAGPLAQRAAARATLVRPTAAAAATRIAQTVSASRAVQATPASPDVSSETEGAFGRGCNGCNLQNADLHGQDFRGAHFLGANMQNADLHDAKLRNAVLIGVNLRNANLDGADLRGAHLTGTDLQGASMHRTLTTVISLTGTILP